MNLEDRTTWADARRPDTAQAFLDRMGLARWQQTQYLGELTGHEPFSDIVWLLQLRGWEVHRTDAIRETIQRMHENTLPQRP